MGVVHERLPTGVWTIANERGGLGSGNTEGCSGVESTSRFVCRRSVEVKKQNTPVPV